MTRRGLIWAGALGGIAVALYVGATLIGGMIDPRYSHIKNAISELTGSGGPNRAVLAPLYIAYNVVLVGFGYALFLAASRRVLFGVAVGLFVLGALSGIGQVTVFRMDSVGATASDAGMLHLILAGVSSLLTLATAVLYGYAFRREPMLQGLSTYSFATAVLLVLSAPLAVGSIGTELMGLFERITVGVFMVWIVVVSAYSLRAARRTDSPPRRVHSASSQGMGA